MTGKLGSINHVKNGIKGEMNGNSKNNNPGLILLDSSSAAIIGRTTNFHRSVGPGVVFTTKDEKIIDAIDLQIQKRIIGPLENEDPYSIRQHKQKSDLNESLDQRASETKAITRDGIEMVASFSITFKIKSKPGEGNTPFGYNPLSVERALLGQTVGQNSGSHNENFSGWINLPGLLAMDIWRELTHKYKLNELFQINGSNLEYCLEYLHTRLTQKEYEEIDDFGNRTGTQVPSKEFQFLEDRGIEFLEIQLKRIFLPSDVEDGLVNRWESSWSTITTSEKTIITRLRGQAITDGKTAAQKSISELVTQMTLKFSKEGTLTSKNLINQILSSRGQPTLNDSDSTQNRSNDKNKSNH